MSYSNLIFNNDSETNISFSSQAVSAPNVMIKYNGTSLHTIAGPTPLVDINNSVSNDANNFPEYMVSTISIQGKIVRNHNASDNAGLTPPTPGISGILGAIDEFKKLFSDCGYSNLVIECDGNSLYSASGVSIKDINFKQTGDNWTKTADYDITLEHYSKISGVYESDPFVTNKTDRWSVEQIDDTFYTDTSANISHQAAEYSNPVLGATYANQVPGQNVGGGNTTGSSLRIVNLPQFRITHSVSAKGLPPNTGVVCDLTTMNRICLENAKNWVEKQLDNSVKSGGGPNTPSGVMPFISHLPTNTFFFNHIRSVNIDLGSYEVTDSWLAMPSGIPYTETYSIESSTNEDLTKNVRVVGNIVGLHPVATGLINNGLDIQPNSSIDTSVSLTKPATINSSFSRLDDNATSTQPNIKPDKYNNALSGWLYDIKPHLYRRACLVMNSVDRTLQYTNPALSNQPPNNPIYSRERPLSTIPSTMNEGHDPRKGTINYSVEYRNNLRIISGVISENIDVQYDVPHDEVATITVPGRALGPILARTGRSASRKTINISVVVMPPTGVNGTLLSSRECPVYTGGSVYKTIQDIILGNKPFVGSPLINSRNTNGIVYTQADNESWSPSQGRYSRNVQWIYQACNIGKDYMEH